MGNHHRQEVVSLNVKPKELSNLVSPSGNLWLLVKDELVDNVLQDFSAMWLDLMLAADDKVIKLVQALFHQMLFEREVGDVLHDALHKDGHVLSHNVFGTFSRNSVWGEEIDLKGSSLGNLGHLFSRILKI